jgi:hypothetical protein
VLADETLVFPGHDYRGLRVSSIGQEKLTNERVAGKSRTEFVDLMNNLVHSRPRLADTEMPSPLRCGRSGELIDIHAA